jgi:hypothetical protein
MHLRLLAVVATLGGISAACAKGPSFDEFRSIVKDLAGAGARDCGLIPLRETDHRLLACAKDAIARKDPFSIIVKRQGIDSEVFSGIARSKNGELWGVDWDSDIGGQARAGSSLNRTRCVRIDFEARLYANDSIQCAPK